ncbi:hypothetical protein [Streptomyces orinoci]|uniref:Integral membrane protein n=1 Tax=Streptomyces orinoci TaxID=67339 RepID=A0ABV3K7I6_STRON|nr:hypothetical protein [Streptomyces orinoci]
MTTPTPPPPSSHFPGSTAIKCLIALATYAFALITFIVLPFSVMASDNCDSPDPRLICSPTGQNIVAWTPIATALTAVVLTTWGLVSRRESAPAGLVGALTLLVAAWAVVGGITG